MMHTPSIARIAAVGISLMMAAMYPQGPALAQQSEARSAPVEASGNGATSLLWKIQDADNTVYLLGSIHLLTPDVYPLDAAIEDAFQNAERVVFEVPMDSVAMRAPEMMALGVFTDGGSLESVLTPETYEMTRSTLSEYGLSPEQFALFEPWLLALTLSSIEWQKAGLEPQYGIDSYFTRRAVEEGKALGALETVDFQLRLFDNLAPDTQDAFLRSTLEQLDETERLMGEVTAAWQAGDAERINALVNDDMARYPAIYAVLLTERNHNWLPQIEAFIEGSEDVLVVVGAAHLVGDQGVVELLRRRGYRTEQL